MATGSSAAEKAVVSDKVLMCVLGLADMTGRSIEEEGKRN